MSFLKTRGLFYKVGILYLCKYGSGAAIVSVLFNFTYIRFLSSNAFSKSFFKYASTKVNPNTGFRHLKERHIFYQLFEKFLHFFFSSCPRLQSENGVGSTNILGPTTTTTATTTTSSRFHQASMRSCGSTTSNNLQQQQQQQQQRTAR